jgi:hypothetical protein
MLEFALRQPLGDDVFDDDPTVHRLQVRPRDCALVEIPADSLLIGSFFCFPVRPDAGSAAAAQDRMVPLAQC